MATGTHIRTYFEGRWHDGNVAIMHAADHGAWLGSGVFDGARSVNGLTPDLAAHCERVNRSAEAMMLTPTVSTDDMVEIVLDGLTVYAPDAAVYIRPMYWGIDGDVSAIVPLPDTTGFAICLELIPLAPPTASIALTRTQFCRPTLDNAVLNAKAGCLYPNNACWPRRGAKGLATRWLQTVWAMSPKPRQQISLWQKMVKSLHRLPTAHF